MTEPMLATEILLLRGLKKTAILLLLLARLERPANTAEIARLLDLSLKTTRTYLHSLSTLGFVEHGPAGWALAGWVEFPRLPIPQMVVNIINAFNNNHPDQDLLTANSIPSTRSCQQSAQDGGSGGPVRVLEASATRRRSPGSAGQVEDGLQDEAGCLSSAEVLYDSPQPLPNPPAGAAPCGSASRPGSGAVSQQISTPAAATASARRKRRAAPLEGCARESARAWPDELAGVPDAIREAFADAGIDLNWRTQQLAKRPWITPEYIHRYMQALAERGKGGQTGLLITLLERGGPAPIPEVIAEEDRTRYIRGKYAAYIEH